MIQDAMRKHKRIFFGVLLVFLIGPFVLWGGSFGMQSGREHEGGGQVVAVVDNTPISAEDFRRQLQAQRQQMAQFGGKEPSMEQMLQDGTAMKVLDGLVGRQLLDEEAQKGGYNFDRSYIVDQIKKWPDFQDEQGNFDPKRWNAAVRQSKNWNAFYDAERMQLARQLVVKRAAASARVLDADLRKQFEDQNTAYELKYVVIAPKVDPTEEQIKETYDKSKSDYDLPEKRKADYVAVSLVPAKPALADEIVTRARNGEDFQTLAKQYSTAPSKDTGGDLDWMTEGPVISPHRKPAFSLKKGEVSDPIYGPNGYYIYKVEDERTNATTNAREIKAREILVDAKLSEADYKAAQDKAKQIADAAKANGDLAAAAKVAGLHVQSSGLFSIDSVNIDNVPDVDARFFRSHLSEVGLNAVSDPFEAQRNIYVAKVTELQPGVPQPLDAVHDKVKQDTIARISSSPEYRKQCGDLASEIAKNAKSLEDIVSQHPELNATIQSIPPFTVKTYDFNKGPMWNPREVMDMAKTKDAGAFFGPVTDFLGKSYFVQLVSKTPPDDKAWAEEWPKQEKQLREQALQQEQNRRLDDYIAYLREDLFDKGAYRVDQAALVRALGLAPDQQEEQQKSDAEQEGAPPETSPAPAQSAAGTAGTTPLPASASPAGPAPGPAAQGTTPAPGPTQTPAEVPPAPAAP